MEHLGDARFARARSVVRTLHDAGHQALYAGGCVRDALLRRPVRDIDIATSATPEQVMALFRRTVPIGRAFGVIQVIQQGETFDVATFREDRGYSDGRRPDAVTYAGAEEDARRRDFTINGMFYDPLQNRILDVVDGQRDIYREVVRTIGEARERFREDDLRMLRAVRFAAVLGFSLDADLEQAIQARAGQILRISPERITQEVTRILLEAPRPGDALRLMDRCGLLEPVLPEVKALQGVEQPPQFHPEGDVWTHTLMMLDRMTHRSPTLAYAVLLHDIGKPATAARTVEPDGSTRIRFNRHAAVGAEIAAALLQRFRLPTRQIQGIVHCVANHMRFMDVPRMREATLRRLVGARTFPVELELHRLDCLCSHGDLGTYHQVRAYAENLQDTPELPAPWVNGHDVMAMGVSPGPAVGQWLEAAYDAQLDGRIDSREALLTWLRSRIQQPNDKSAT